MPWAVLPNMINLLLADHGGKVVVIMVSHYQGLTDLSFSKHKECVSMDNLYASQSPGTEVKSSCFKSSAFISVHYFTSVHVFKLLPARWLLSLTKKKFKKKNHLFFASSIQWVLQLHKGLDPQTSTNLWKYSLSLVDGSIFSSCSSVAFQLQWFAVGIINEPFALSLYLCI